MGNNKHNTHSIMNKILYTFFTCFLFILSSQAEERYDLRKMLDSKIEQREYYMQIKENRIDSLCKLITPQSSLVDQYLINDKIYHEYSTYRYDSAKYYITLNENISERLGIQKYKDEVKLRKAMLLSTTGLFKEAIETLESINRGTLDESLLTDYYMTNEWAYLRIKNYVDDEVYSPVYRQKELLYIDSTFQQLEQGTIDYYYYKGYIMFQQGKMDEAKTVLLDLLSKLNVDSRLYAIVTSNIATIYKSQGDQYNYEIYLIRSAISDQVCALKENRSMQELAMYLFQEHPEELDRANLYIQCAMEDAQFFNNRVRTIQIARKLPVIVSAFQDKSRIENRNLRITLGTISFLVVGLILALFYIYKQIKLVKESRLKLRKLNNQLNSLNTELTDSNSKLSEANKMREEYVGLFIDISSSYINKMAQYRDTVKRKILAKQIDELYKISNSSELLQTEIAEFFDNFDTAFLNLYPTFITDFNTLLTEEGKIKLKNTEKLSPELRVFALIRLGITDSSKIASFLRFSPQTVYNYRAKVKKFSVVDRNDFEKYVMEIGNLI